MIEFETHSPDATTATPDGRNCSVSPISDPGLAMLREQVKNIMIPLLIKVFHIKLEAQQASSPPSRLQSKQPENKVQELVLQLEKLDEDLKLMIGWCQSCRNQVGKVLAEVNTELKPPSPIHSPMETNPAVHKSFTDALASQQEAVRKAKSLHTPKESSCPNSPPVDEKNPWWDRFFKR